MSDVLERLAMRARGDASEVRPRLPGRFEAEGTAALDPHDRGETEATAGDQARRAPVRRPGDRRADAGPSPSAAPRLLPAKPADPLSDGAKLKAHTEAAGEADGPTTPPDRHDLSGGTDPAATPSTPPIAAPPHPPERRDAHDKSTTSSLMPVRVAAPAVPSGPTPRQPAGVPPDIRISIGRIDVRAPPASPAPSRRADPGARLMSLDDYLARGRAR